MHGTIFREKWRLIEPSEGVDMSVFSGMASLYVGVTLPSVHQGFSPSIGEEPHTSA
jgi:hypothetical protein